MERPLNILLVDDDSVDVMNVQRVFRKHGITSPIWIASNGLEALEMLRNGTVPSARRLILLDLNMPKMNGIEFLREVRRDAQLAASSVVVLTTSREERDQADVFGLNAAGYLLKPIEWSEFVALMEALNRRWTLAELP